MANSPKTPQELYDELTSAFAEAELVGNELQSQLQQTGCTVQWAGREWTEWQRVYGA